MNGIFANYLWTMFWGKRRILNILRIVWFSRENTNIDVCVFMFDLRMINMSSECEYDWHWKISACSTEYEAYDFAHSPPIFIFWLGRLIFSVSINSHPHPDNIYLYILLNMRSSFFVQIHYKRCIIFRNWTYLSSCLTFSDQ
jgi:hypothetical protein